MNVRCYFRDTSSANNVGRVDVEMGDCEHYPCPKMVYDEALQDVRCLLEQGGAVNPVVLAVVK